MTNDIQQVEPPESPTVILLVVSIVQFMTPFMSSAVGVALPAIGNEFNANAIQLSMIQMIFAFALVVFILPMGRLADIHGRKKMFLTGIVLVTLSTLALGLAPNITVFIIFRTVQGVGSSMISSTSIAILSSVFPPERRGRALGVIAAFAYIGLAIAPPIAGMITTYLGWRWVLYFMIPFQVMAMLLTLFKLKGEWADSRGETFDLTGALVCTGAFTLIICSISMFMRSDLAGFLLAGGLIGLYLFYRIESRTTMPLLDVRLLLQNRIFAFSNIAGLISYGTASGVLFIFSLYLQYIKGCSAQQAGLLLMIQPFFQAILSPATGRLSDKFSPSRMAPIGMVLCTIGLFVTATIGTDTSMVMIILSMTILGIGFGLFAAPNITIVMGSVQPSQYYTASSISALSRPFGVLLGTAITTAIFSVFMGDQMIHAGNSTEFISSIRLILIIFAKMSSLGIFISLVRSPSSEP